MIETLAKHPDLAVGLAAAGCLAIYVEFLRPGLVFPCVLGSIALLSAVAALIRNPNPSPAVLLTAFVCWSAVTLVLLRIAVRARRNKMGE